MNDLGPLPAGKSEALAARYGRDSLPAAGPWNDHIASLLSHRSVRSYRPDPVPEGTLESLVAAAQSAATSSNLQVWSVISVSDADSKRELADIAGGQTHIEQCPLYLVALAAQNAVVAAESLGLSTVYIGAMRNDPARVARLLDLPQGVMAVFGLCVGYAADGAHGEVKPRLPQQAVLHRERYGQPDEAALCAVYDREMATFSRRQGMGQATWTDRVLVRLGKLASMNGREALKQVIRTRGFPLR